MKILIIPDVHGKPDWQIPCKLDEFDKIVFTGDYFDSFTITGDECRRNFKDILYFKINNPERVILLAGNHDNHYIYYHSPTFKSVKCSGFNASAAWGNATLLRENLDHIQAAWEYDNILISHAGITEKHYQQDIKYFWDRTKPLSELLNTMWRTADRRIFQCGIGRYGMDVNPSIFWTDKSELEADPMLGRYQIVGHTPVKQITTIVHNDSTKMTFVDCVEHYNQEYLVINM